MKYYMLLFVSFLTSFFIFSQNTHAQSIEDRILEYSSKIEIQKNSDLIVTEDIRVVKASGDKIKRGIYRDFPTRYKGKYGETKNVGFKVLEIKKNGQDEDYHIENVSNGKRIYIGSEDVIIPNGIFTYTIKYLTTKQLGFFEYHDEINFNAIGTGWDFSIENANIIVEIPSVIKFEDLKIDGFVGAFGGTGRDFDRNISFTSDKSVINFRLTRPLSTYEGFTIFVGFPKNIISEPSLLDKALDFLLSNWGLILVLILSFFILGYYFYMWNRYGKDPKSKVIIPEYEEPKRFSPGAVRYLDLMNFDEKSLSSTLINLAVKKIITLHKDEDGKYVVILEDKNYSSNPKILEDEKVYLDNLLKGEKLFKFDQKNYQEISKAKENFFKEIESRILNKYFVKNSRLIILPIIFTILSDMIILLTLPEYFIAISVVCLVIGFLFHQAFKAKMHEFKGRISLIKKIFYLFVLSLVTTAIIGAVLLVDFLGILYDVNIFAGVLVVLQSFSHFIFYELLKARTKLGRETQDKIEGLRLFLSTVEGHRYAFDKLSLPKTFEMYEKYLPFAVSLNVEPEWSKQFHGALVKLGKSSEDYRPAWYSGNYSGFSSSNLSHSIASGLTSSIASSSSAPGSSSGSGGSSGGGGGGGGGGGW